MARPLRLRSAPILIALLALSACAAPEGGRSAEAAPGAAAQSTPAAPAEAAAPERVEPQKTAEQPSEKEPVKEPAKTPAPPPAVPPSDSVKGSPSASDYIERPDVRAFLQELSTQRNIPFEWLESEVRVARYSPLSERYTTPRPNANKKTTPEKNFRLYERNLVDRERISRGAAFLEENRAVFERIEAETGVSRYAVAAIIGIESIYGRNMGSFRVLDALMTLSFDYTRRAKYYRAELANFLEFCWLEKTEPVTVTGSFAGAMGLGQFMPSSLKAYGRDGDGDGRIDVVGNDADGIASVANFLLVHGWVRGERPLYRVAATPEIFAATGSGGIKTHTTAGELLRAGVRPMEPLPLKDDEPTLLVDLPWVKSNNERGVDYFMGTGSFAAILRYNRSYFYAAAVSFLADELEEKEKEENPPAAKPSAPAASAETAVSAAQ